MKNLVIMKADSNDADYVYSISKNIPIEDLEIIRKVSKVISDNKNHSWGKGDLRDKYNDPYIIYKDQLTEREIDFFNDYSPYFECGLQDIESIDIYEIQNEENLL